MNRRTPSLPSTVPDALDRLPAAFARRVAVDRRALAAFRAALGALVIADLALRSRDLVAFYTDAGVLPRSALFADYGTVYSVHAVSGAPWAQALLFLLAGAVALALVVGYRTRAATAVTWLLLVSLHLRNSMVLNGGDTLLRMLLFWAIFLPLGDRWAVDARTGADETETTAASVGTMAVLLQVVLMYGTNAVHKTRSDAWTSGEAVAYVFQADHLTILLGDALAGYPAPLEAFTYLWMALILASPLLLVLTDLPRAALASAFAGMHLGMLVTLRIDLFPLIAVAGLIPFYPPVVWDAAESLADRIGAAAAVESLSERVAPPAVVSVPAAVSLGRSADLASDSSATAALSAALERARGAFLTLVPCVFLVLVVTSNAAAVDYATTPDAGDRALDAIRGDQNWRMFAPTPTRTTKWFAAPAALENGSEVDLLHRSRVDLDRPARAQDAYPTSRWRKYLVNARFADNEKHRSYLANYLCERWNEGRGVDAESVTVYYLYERTDPYDGTTASGETAILTYDCDGEFVQSAG
ncbi:HTTM domain-containing protein [Halostella sp. JP-L12]|uniref:HTTM domain-containing protein n=1 Tax=Halostella TaxID=1843185 RepID=UPI000EF84BD9|nr:MULTISPECIES: HTTM domain-containing protein [Halostella]NHN47814.1 HTTM domain-containing protein [Halostella sp. JP-L12]